MKVLDIQEDIVLTLVVIINTLTCTSPEKETICLQSQGLNYEHSTPYSVS